MRALVPAFPRSPRSFREEVFMRLPSRYLALTSLFVAAAVLAAGDTSGKVEYFRAGEVDTARASGDTGSLLISNSEFKVMASRRDKPGQSEVHAADTDIFIVIDGTATIVIGGKMIEPQQVSTGETRGSGIEGGKEYQLEKGVVLTVPRNTPHWVKETKPGFRYFVVKSVARS
jgi:mannose-6-phosphate isomerase-like protein (cupin superfamily)